MKQIKPALILMDLGPRAGGPIQKNLAAREKKLRYTYLQKTAKDKRLRDKLKKQRQHELKLEHDQKMMSIVQPEEVGYLQQEGHERTEKFRQSSIKEALDINAARKRFDLKLHEYGPYSLDYSRNGRYLLLGGSRGHIFMTDWLDSKPMCEFQVNQSVRDVHFLHNENLFAVAQKKYVYLYDNQGIEVQILKDMIDVSTLDFLPYHLLLTSIGTAGVLTYQDVSTGSLVARLKTRAGPCSVMCHNEFNGISILGHGNGVVTLWSPNCRESQKNGLVSMKCHYGAVSDASVGYVSDGMTGVYPYLVTTGIDGLMKVWDLRMYETVQTYNLYSRGNGTCIDVSQKGMIAVGGGRNGDKVLIYKDAITQHKSNPHLTHQLDAISSRVSSNIKKTLSLNGRAHNSSTGHTQQAQTNYGSIRKVKFCPYDDALGIGHGAGFSSIIVPGSGEPNYDSMEADPFETKKRRREGEVKAHLDKLPASMITLDVDQLGRVSERHQDRVKNLQELKQKFAEPKGEYDPSQGTPKKAKKKSKLQIKLAKQQKNVISREKIQLQHQLAKEKQEKARKRKLQELRRRNQQIEDNGGKVDPLERFMMKDE
ncbi:putative U3 small nucleolar RNA-associated protein 7 [Blattamonas nauphoetae]|uniref:U3 small nucleolar RNA-associated protein 7 n=1 Tax=Blattamonas nauphoetae TaxID=2049346 RepID=A0ABQ9YCS4_9EUKA|nr:putative U3 small nucleolar RNA-associated protein 7 [Blattamonas nauphoetae]